MLKIITNSNFIAQTQSILKKISLLNVKNILSFNILNFLHKLSHNTSPPYFESYKPFFLKKNYYHICSPSSPFATLTNLSCLYIIKYPLSVSSYEKYHFSKQHMNNADNNLKESPNFRFYQICNKVDAKRNSEYKLWSFISCDFMHYIEYIPPRLLYTQAPKLTHTHIAYPAV